ncbi:helix-turn-helix domain-containing protein [Erwinia mallotivora]|uniref:helix-turn-helix domain-containing protein n=1 Tax=Erwinia mallotivora TaxID=69222 RepID=UPI0021BF6E6D|nr:helix-turn-helix domain-containing protein [Erwinia mallotivora]
MDKPKHNLEKILTLFERKGIEKRKQASTMAEILDIQYNSAKQKLDEKRGITYQEVKKIHHWFNEPLDDRKNYNGLFIVNDMHIRCNIEVSTEIVEFREPGINYATKKGNYYIVNPTEPKVDKDMKKVVKMELLPAPKLAILDNDIEIIELLQNVSNRYGIDGKIFQTVSALNEAIDKESFDGYVIDWLLDFGETSESAIKKIRIIDEKTPIILLTGQLNHHEKDIGEAIMNYGVELIEKPTRTFILSSILLANLFY